MTLTGTEALIADIMKAELHERFHGKKISGQEVAEVVAKFLDMKADDVVVTHNTLTGQVFIDIKV
jgi:hypothetical protein